MREREKHTAAREAPAVAQQGASDVLQERNQRMIGLGEVMLDFLLAEISAVRLERPENPFKIMPPFGRYDGGRRDGIVRRSSNIAEAYRPRFCTAARPGTRREIPARKRPPPSVSSLSSSAKEASASSAEEYSVKKTRLSVANCELWRQQLTAAITEMCRTGMHQSSQQAAGSSMKLISAPWSIR